ncbi:MAG: M15 family metallopeptidase [bacterium]
MASRELTDLTPELKRKAEQFLAICEVLHIRVFVTCTLRSNEEQDELYAQGRTKPGKIVTNAKGGEGKHNPGPDGKSRAFDVAFRLGERGATWEGPWDVLGKIAALVGLIWGGDWVHFKDLPHFQL